MHPSKLSHTEYTTIKLTSIPDSWWHQLQLRNPTTSFHFEASSTTNGGPKSLRRTPFPRALSPIPTSVSPTHILREQYLRNGLTISKAHLHYEQRTQILCAAGYRPSVAGGAQKQYLQSAFIQQWSEYAPEFLSTSACACRCPTRPKTVER